MRIRSAARARATVLLACAAVAATTLLAPATGAAAGITWSLAGSYDLGGGVTLQRWTEPVGPTKAFVLRFDPAASPGTLDVVMPGAALPASAPVSKLGISNGAIAAVNGDFGQDRPDHATAVDGTLWQTGPQHGENFSLSADESVTYIGKGRPRVTATGPSGTFAVDRFNSGAPVQNQIAGYSDEGGKVENAPLGSCSVRLKPSGAPFWGAGRKSLGRAYVVDATKCRKDKIVAEQPGMTVLATRRALDNTSRHFIKDLVVGQSVTMKWSMTGWPGVLDTIGGRPLLVHAGANVAPTTPCSGNSALYCKNPRTGVGVDASGTVLLAVVDGRQSGWSMGLTPTDFADLFIHLGAVDAMNLDGGGSAEMWVANANPLWCTSPTAVAQGCIVNRANSNPGGFKERAVENAIAVLPGADPGEASPPTGP
jgi:Phosphodiester glycosidase